MSDFTTQNYDLNKIAMIGNYPPRRCGIATFTLDISTAVRQASPNSKLDVFAMSDRDGYNYPPVVKLEIAEQDASSYRSAATYIKDHRYDVVSVQHEYGIFGGEAGRYLLTMLRGLDKPIVTSLHTVLNNPSFAQKTVTAELLELSERVIVMSKRAADILQEIYGADRSKIDLVPHGIPCFPRSSGSMLRSLLDINGPFLLTFGLLSPGKGIEYALEAMPEILKREPRTVYVVLGATHPNIVRDSGEEYRQSLEDLAERLGVADNVRFVDQFVTQEELVSYISAADVYISPSLSPEQITSGTLAYAVGAGKSVVATRNVYAQELLDDRRGILIPFRSSQAIADAVNYLHDNPEEKARIEDKACAYGEQMQWSEVAKLTLASFRKAAADYSKKWVVASRSASSGRLVPEINLDHLMTLTDDTGMYQHATYTVPNQAEGYCVDDNARALLLTAYWNEAHPESKELAQAQMRYLSFVCDAFNPANSKFRNFMDFQRNWLEEEGSEDSQGRSVWALASFIARSRLAGSNRFALKTYEMSCSSLLETTSPRTWAYGILAAHEIRRIHPDHAPSAQIERELGNRLWDLYESASTPEWAWFEKKLAYGNARLSEALLRAGEDLKCPAMVHDGLQSLRWLAQKQTADSGMFAPVGTNSYFPEANPYQNPRFDQQPLEAWDSVAAYLAACELTGDGFWRSEAEKAYRWFLGENMVGIALYDPATGGCRDGLHENAVNENQGAESTLSFLCASLNLVNAKVDVATKNPTVR